MLTGVKTKQRGDSSSAHLSDPIAWKSPILYRYSTPHHPTMTPSTSGLPHCRQSHPMCSTCSILPLFGPAQAHLSISSYKSNVKCWCKPSGYCTCTLKWLLTFSSASTSPVSAAPPAKPTLHSGCCLLYRILQYHIYVSCTMDLTHNDEDCLQRHRYEELFHGITG